MKQSDRLKMIEKIARAICAGERCEPDSLVLQDNPPQLGARGHALAIRTVPAWQLYWRTAEVALEAIERSEVLG